MASVRVASMQNRHVTTTSIPTMVRVRVRGRVQLLHWVMKWMLMNIAGENRNQTTRHVTTHTVETDKCHPQSLPLTYRKNYEVLIRLTTRA